MLIEFYLKKIKNRNWKILSRQSPDSGGKRVLNSPFVNILKKFSVVKRKMFSVLIFFLLFPSGQIMLLMKVNWQTCHKEEL